MRVGTKSLLFGVHQFIWHPFTVFLAWCELYSLPNWKELICIIIHDWGYWGCPNMDGKEGENHPRLAAKIAGRFFGKKYYNLCLYHSRHYAKNNRVTPSKLCWADKLSIKYEPAIIYLPRAWVTGELKEYREKSAKAGYVPIFKSHYMWYKWVKKWLIDQAKLQRSAKKLVNNNYN